MVFSIVLLLTSVPLLAQKEYYTGALAGISTLSADGQSAVTASNAIASSYKPENGPSLNIFGGIHLNDFLSFQANYSGNRNELSLSSVRSSGAAFEQKRESSQQSLAADVALYFRNRRSRVRPYLSVGLGATRFKSTSVQPATIFGAFDLPPREFHSTSGVFRTAVGIDVGMGRGWAFRYCFLEAIQPNPISKQLAPPGERRMANFQSLFGFAKTFQRTVR